jgi:hypothetical protein
MVQVQTAHFAQFKEFKWHQTCQQGCTNNQDRRQKSESGAG